MARRRSKSTPYVRRQWLAFKEIGEITPCVTGYILRVRYYEEGPLEEFRAATTDLLEKHKAMVIQADLDDYEAYARSGGLLDDVPFE